MLQNPPQQAVGLAEKVKRLNLSRPKKSQKMLIQPPFRRCFLVDGSLLWLRNRAAYGFVAFHWTASSRPYVWVSPDTSSFSALVRAGFPKIGRMSGFCTLEPTDYHTFLKVNAKHSAFCLFITVYCLKAL